MLRVKSAQLSSFVNGLERQSRQFPQRKRTRRAVLGRVGLTALIFAFALAASMAQAQTWISYVNVSPGASGATVSWTTAVPADSQVEYGTTASYGNASALASGLVTSHSVALSGMQSGVNYHCRVRSRDSAGVLVVGLDYTFSISAPVSVSVSAASATVVSGATQQLTATVTNSSNPAVAWSAAMGSVSSSGLFTAPVVASPTTVSVTATSVADPTKSAVAMMTVTPLVAISISPKSASLVSGGQQQFAATVSGASNTAVTWSVSAGAITGNGLFTAPTVSAPVSVIVTATSQADPTKTASAAVSVSAPAPAGTFLLGDQTVESTLDTGNAGVAEAVQISAAATGTLNALDVYVDAASTAATWIVGLYNDSGGHPGTLLAAGTSTSFQRSAWNAVSVTPVGVTAGSKYWIAILGGGGTVAFRVKYGSSGGADEIESVRTLTSLPATWQGGTFYSGVTLAAFGSGIVSSSSGGSPVLSVSPANLSFSAQAGAGSLTPQSVSIANTGTGSLTFTGVSDQSWLVLSASSGTAPASLAVQASASGLAAGSYTGHLTISGAGSSKVVTASLTVTQPAPVQHSVLLSWHASTSTNVISYNIYRSPVSGSSYGLIAGSVGALAYTDASVQSGTSYYYVVTALDNQGRESAYSNESRAVVP